MNRKADIVDIAVKDENLATQLATSIGPKILGGRPLPELKLPADFDFTYHKKILASGEVKPATHEDFVQQIAALKQLKNNFG